MILQNYLLLLSYIFFENLKNFLLTKILNPHNSRHNDKSAGKQICVIPFQRDFLLKYISLPMTPLEEHESIDMLRIIEHGYKIKMVPTKSQSYSVDTEEVVEEETTIDLSNLKIGKVWIAPGCIVCNACEEICPEVFDVQEETCVIKPEPDLELVQDIVAAAEACPVEVIKFQPA